MIDKRLSLDELFVTEASCIDYIDELEADNERMTAELAQARARIAELEADVALLVSRQWVSVESRLPEEDEEVIAMTTRKSKHTRCIRTYFRDGEFYNPFSSDNVTHWMPLPEPPEAR